MLSLAEAGEWKSFVSAHYGEQHKMDKPAEQMPKLVARLEKNGATLISRLKECVGKEPKLSADGTVATWPSGFKLHKKDGKWGFHL